MFAAWASLRWHLTHAGHSPGLRQTCQAPCTEWLSMILCPIVRVWFVPRLGWRSLHSRAFRYSFQGVAELGSVLQDEMQGCACLCECLWMIYSPMLFRVLSRHFCATLSASWSLPRAWRTGARFPRLVRVSDVLERVCPSLTLRVPVY